VFERLGERAIRVPRPLEVSAAAIVRAVKQWPGVIDVVVAKQDVAAYFDRDPRIVAGAIDQLSKLAVEEPPARDLQLRAIYDGEDLALIAKLCGLSMYEVVLAHSQATYTVETMGFAPGFAYLAGLDRRLVLPRRSTPRTRVRAGSIAIAGEHTAVYPFDSPGGWHLLGHVDVRMFGERGALLQLGDRVRFVEHR
jgi:KipI family sensor histidine kinase inhibitor